LLTGRAPFEEGNLVTLVANVLQDPPVSPSERRPGVSRDLSAVVLRALAKAPGDRFQTYEAFDAALRPFSSDAPAAASPGPRFIAAVLDSIIVNLPLMPLQIGVLAAYALQSRAFIVVSWLVSFTAYLGYYFVLEGKWGASLGKRLVGLRVVTRSGDRAPVRAILVRTIVYLLVMQTPQLGMTLFVGPDFFLRQRSGLGMLGVQLLMPSMFALSLAVLFGRARAANQYAGLHDRVSDTRVVVRPPVAARASRRVSLPPSATAIELAPLGPFRVARAARLTPGDVVAGSDDALHRQVWIQIAAADAPPIAAARRDLDRPARLRWLGGHRSEPVGWDAFEAPDGVPLVAAACDSTAEWQRLMLQLATEIDAAVKAGDLPALSLSRVWVTDHGDVRLLDFVPPSRDIDLARHDEVTGDWQLFLHRVALSLLAAPRDAPGNPLPADSADGVPWRAGTASTAGRRPRTSGEEEES
jgi:uncharacterized RDD family membrane protein YckC